jgi:subtilisin family serine protease
MKIYRVQIIFFLMICGLTSELSAQDRYAVFFKYKPQEKFSLASPLEFLSPKALDRRVREDIKVDSTDLPVSSKYVFAVSQKADQVLYQTKWLNAAIVVASTEKVAEIKNLPFVSKVEFVGKGFLERSKSRIDPSFPVERPSKKLEKIQARELQKSQNSYDFQNQLIGIPEMHKAGFRGKGVVIAVFDAGFPGANTASPFLHLQVKNQILGTGDFVRPWNQDVYSGHQHGTNVLSLIASDESGKMIAGAPDASFILVITEEVDTEYRVEEFNWVKGAEFADSLGVDIINSSLGYLDFDDPAMNYSIKSLDGNTAIITQGASLAAKKGILVVNSVGNNGPNQSTLMAPSDAKGILSIGSVNQDLNVSNFSSRGPTGDLRIKPDLVTLGSGTSLVTASGSIGKSNGTSFSAPQITALAAGLWEARPEWKKDEMILNLLKSATKSENPDYQVGFGIPSFQKTLEITNSVIPIDPETEKWKIFPNPLESTVEFFIQFETGLESELTVFDTSGKLVLKTQMKRASINEPYQVNLSNLSLGTYVIQVSDGLHIKRGKLFKI